MNNPTDICANCGGEFREHHTTCFHKGLIRWYFDKRHIQRCCDNFVPKEQPAAKLRTKEDMKLTGKRYTSVEALMRDNGCTEEFIQRVKELAAKPIEGGDSNGGQVKQNIQSVATAPEPKPIEADAKGASQPGVEVCQVCNWTNTGCLNVGDFGIPFWICHRCIKRERESLQSQLQSARTAMEKLKGFLEATAYSEDYRIQQAIITLSALASQPKGE